MRYYELSCLIQMIFVIHEYAGHISLFIKFSDLLDTYLIIVFTYIFIAYILEYISKMLTFPVYSEKLRLLLIAEKYRYLVN